MRRPKAYFPIIVALLLGAEAMAQAPLDETVRKVEALRQEYRFAEAAEICAQALEHGTMDPGDSLRLEQLRMENLNGENMLHFASTPTVVARKQLSLKDFYLWYPKDAGSWCPTPNAFDSSSAFPGATYVPDGAREIYFSAHDEDGLLSIMRTEHSDTLWSAPVIADEKLTTGGNEVFPYVSADGRTLWFASDGLYGAGGYDLYVSHWDSRNKEWGEPENLGFPYNSPYNDYLFVNTPDGRYSIFASDRECPGTGDVWVYVLEFDTTPVRRALSAQEALSLSRLMVPAGKAGAVGGASGAASGAAGAAFGSSDGQSGVGGSAGTSAASSAGSAGASAAGADATRRYVMQLREVQSLKDRIARSQESLDLLRSRMSKLAAEEQKEVADEILENEMSLVATRDELNKATRTLQSIEMDLIADGIVVDPKAVLAASDDSDTAAIFGGNGSAGRGGAGYAGRVGTGSAGRGNDLAAFEFIKADYGQVPQMQFAKPKSSFDYTFQVLKVGRFAEDNTLPDGLIYQIQIFSKTSGEAKESDLKGLSPVFVRKDGSKKAYSAGLFRSYSDCLSALSRVKRAGFPSAVIVAFRDGDKIAVNTARQLEKTIVQNYRIRIRPDGGRLSESALSAINNATTKDLVRETQDGVLTYVLGNWTDIDDASTVLSALKAAGLLGLTLETVTQ